MNLQELVATPLDCLQEYIIMETSLISQKIETRDKQIDDKIKNNKDKELKYKNKLYS